MFNDTLALTLALANVSQYFNLKSNKSLTKFFKDKTYYQWNLHAESNRNLSRMRILPLDYEDLLQLKQFLIFSLSLVNF